MTHRLLLFSLCVLVATPSWAKRRSRHAHETDASTTPAPASDAPSAELPNLTPAAPPPPAPATAAPVKPAVPRFTRVMVGTLKRDPEVPEKVARFVAEALVQEVRKLEHVQVNSAADIDEMLTFEEQKRLVGCSDEVCLSEIVAAMGVDQLITGSLSSTKSAHVLTLKRLDVTAAKTISTVTRELKKQDGEEFLAAVGPAVETLFPDVPLKPGVVRGVSPEVARRLNPPPLPRWSFFTAAAVSAVLAGGATVEALNSKDAQSQYQSLASQSLSSPISGAQLVELGRTATSRAHTANVLFAAAGGVALTAGVMAFFVDWHPSPEPAARAGQVRVAVSPTPGPDQLSIAVRLP